MREDWQKKLELLALIWKAPCGESKIIMENKIVLIPELKLQAILILRENGMNDDDLRRIFDLPAGMSISQFETKMKEAMKTFGNVDFSNIQKMNLEKLKKLAKK